MSTNTSNPDITNHTTVDQVDVRGPRFAAWVTTAVLLLALVVSAFSTTAAAAILAAQAAVFAAGAIGGPRQHPYGRVFATAVAPRLGPVTEREPVAPLKFAQLVGLVFAIAGSAGFVFGAPLLGVIATAFALAAAFLNAAFGICLGCMLYPLVVQLRRTPAA
jgi:MFS family permease